MKLSGRVVRWAWRAAQQAGAVTADTAQARRFAAFGPGSRLAFPPGSVFGQGSIVIGANVLVGEMVSLSAGMVPDQDLGSEPVLRIGDRCVIGRGSHVVAHQSVLIGESASAREAGSAPASSSCRARSSAATSSSRQARSCVASCRTTA